MYEGLEWTWSKGPGKEIWWIQVYTLILSSCFFFFRLGQSKYVVANGACHNVIIHEPHIRAMKSSKDSRKLCVHFQRTSACNRFDRHVSFSALWSAEPVESSRIFVCSVFGHTITEASSEDFSRWLLGTWAVCISPCEAQKQGVIGSDLIWGTRTRLSTSEWET